MTRQIIIVVASGKLSRIELADWGKSTRSADESVTCHMETRTNH